jgi:hypothetical protein
MQIVLPKEFVLCYLKKMGEHTMSLFMLIKDCLLFKKDSILWETMLRLDLGDYAFPLVFSS